MKIIILFLLVFTLSSCKKPTTLNTEARIIIDKWTAANNSKDTALLSSVYAERLFYYGREDVNRNSCILDQISFFRKNKNSYQSIYGEVQFETIGETKIKCTFVKRTTISGKTKDIPSFLIIQKLKNKYKIVAESEIGIEPSIEITNSHIRILAGLRGESIRGDFNGDKQKEEIVAYLIDSKTGKEKVDAFEDNLEGEDYSSENTNTNIVFKCSDEIVQDFSVKCVFDGLFLLHNEGDLDGDGADEISYIQSQQTSAWHGAKVYSIKNGKWKKLTQFVYRLGDKISFHDAIQKSSKKGYVTIKELELGDRDFEIVSREVNTKLSIKN